MKAGQNLILAAAVQSVGRALFNIRVTMVGCGPLRLQELSEDTGGSREQQPDLLMSRHSVLRAGQHQIWPADLPGPERL